MVLVMMRPSVTFPRDTECTDVPAGPQALTFFAQDVPMAISKAYRVQPNGWGTIGDSTGGYCSTKITMLYPAIFHAAVSLSGYYYTLWTPRPETCGAGRRSSGTSTTSSGACVICRHPRSPSW